MVSNRDKKPVIDEALLEETPPSINEPQAKVEEPTPSEAPVEPTPAPEETPIEPVIESVAPVVPVESEADKEKRYRSQQTEAQIQVERNRRISEKVAEAEGVIIPTEQDLRTYVEKDGQIWDDLTTNEQIMVKKTYISEKKFAIVQEAIQASKKVDEWANSVDAFIDTTDSKPEYASLSGHEMEFRKFAMKEAHRGVAIDSLLLPAFLNQLPAPTKVRGSLFEDKGGGEREENVGKITDADTNATLRQTNPREWRRQVKAGNIKIEA